MALIDIRCTNHHVSEVYRSAADWPTTPVCPTCGAATEQIHLPRAVQYTVDPVVVYQAPDGSFRFPGDTTTLSTSKYDRAGFTRIELRSAADVRRFESHMNKRELSRAHRRVERMQEMRERRESASRSDLRHAMQRMSEYGRDVARATMRHNDGKERLRARDAGFHVDAYSNDRSNREESRDALGRRRRD